MNKTKELSPLESMIRTQVLDRGIDDAHLVEAMRRVPREKFFPRDTAADLAYSVERVKPLLDAAFDRLLDLGYRNVHFKFGDGTLGWPEQAPFDRILIAAGAPALPRKLLLAQLKAGGKAVLPVGPQDTQSLVVVTRVGDELISTDVCDCRFVKLIGEEGWGNDGK